MQSFLRLDSNYFSNLKVKKLRRILGAEGVEAHLKLFCYVSAHRPSGKLAGFSREDVEDAVDWAGKPGALIGTLIALRLVDESVDQSLTIHGWQEANQWISESTGMVENAKLQNHIRWHVQRKIKDPDCNHCFSCQSDQSESDTESDTESDVSVTESDTESFRKERKGKKESKPCAFDREEEFTRAFDHDYPRAQGRNVGRTDARKAFDRTVRTAADLADFRKALTNYNAMDEVRRGFVLKAPKFFAKWREDYLCIQPAGRRDIAHGDTIREEGIGGLAL